MARDRLAAQQSACFVVHPLFTRERGHSMRLAAARLKEATGLARAIGLDVAHAEVATVNSRRPSTLFGSGAVKRIGESLTAAAERTGAVQVVFVDAALSPVQQRNLERAWGCKVVDRTGLILEIFGERARTAEGELQVELAALNYQKSRLVRSWTHLERQRGGYGFLGGPGEAQIETDRRLIRERIARLRVQLAQVRRTRELHRRARTRVPLATVALVGYTNAGKSTLFNRLTAAEVLVADQLFATLDPTMRALELPSGRSVILSDTVGFISDLPHELIEAFRATLEEVTEADVILHVRDAADPDSEWQRADVNVVLQSLGIADDNRVIEVLNKIDLLSEDDRSVLANRLPRGNGATTMLSARTGEGCNTLLAVLDDRLSAALCCFEVTLRVDEGAELAWLYRHGEVLQRDEGAGQITLKVRLSPADAARFSHRHDRTLNASGT
jgi:GTP-binding protein HflX